MAARALVAYERPDGRYNCHYAHWGATPELAAAITPATPFGGADPRAEWAAALLRELLTTTTVDPGTARGRVPDGASTRVDPTPLAVAVPRERVPSQVEFGTHEAVHLVDRSFDVTPHLAVPFSLAAVTETRADEDPSGTGERRATTTGEPGGALVPTDGGFGALRERAAGAREALGAAVDGGVAPVTARAALRATLARWVGADRLLLAGGAGETAGGP